MKNKWPKDLFKNYDIIPLDALRMYPDISEFVKRYHYSGSLARGCNRNFALFYGDIILGVAMFGIPTGKAYNGTGTIECKRFVLLKGQPKNVASWFMSKCIKYLKLESEIKEIISFADPEYGHEGVMYRASNFKFVGEQGKKGQVIIRGDERIHLRQAYQKVNGQYTGPALRVQADLRSGKAKYLSLAKKKLFSYSLKK